MKKRKEKKREKTNLSSSLNKQNWLRKKKEITEIFFS